MATIALTDFTITVNSVDLSDHATAVTLNVEVEELENTAFGTSGFRSRQGGLKDWSVEITWNQDFAASEVDATLWAALGTLVTVTGKATSGTTSATNPLYSGTALISRYSPFGNSVGELATVSTTWPGSGALTRSTS